MNDSTPALSNEAALKESAIEHLFMHSSPYRAMANDAGKRVLVEGDGVRAPAAASVGSQLRVAQIYAVAEGGVLWWASACIFGVSVRSRIHSPLFQTS